MGTRPELDTTHASNQQKTEGAVAGQHPSAGNSRLENNNGTRLNDAAHPKSGQAESCAQRLYESAYSDAAPRPRTSKDGSRPGPDSAGETRKLNETELKNLVVLQQQLLNLKGFELEHERKNGKPVHTQEQIKSELEKLKAGLEKDYRDQRFGPATCSAYQNCVRWLEHRGISNQISAIQRADSSITDAGTTPFKLRVNYAQGPLSGSISGGLAPDKTPSSQEPPISTGLDPTKLPDERALVTLNETAKWLGRTEAVLKDRDTEKKIRERGLPPAWNDRTGANPDVSKETSANLIQLSSKVQDYVRAMDQLHRIDGKFPLKLPPGCTVDRDSEGKIKKVNLDLPQDLRIHHPDNERKIEQLTKWLKESGPQIADTYRKVKDVADNRTPLLRYGLEADSGYVSTTDQKHFRELPPAKPGEKTPQGQEYNVSSWDYQVKQLQDGRIEVTPIVQHLSAPTFAADLRGRTPIGPRFEHNELTRVYKPDELVPVQVNGSLKLVEAKHLAAVHDSDKQNQDSSGRVRAAVNTAVIGLMLYSGVGELYGAWGAGGALTEAATLGQVLPAALRTGVAGSMLFDNEAIRATDFGRAIDDARQIYFLADMTGSLANGGYGFLRNRLKLGPMANGSTIGDLLGHTKKAQELAETAEGVIGSSRIANGLNNIGTQGFRLMEPGLAAESVVSHNSAETPAEAHLNRIRKGRADLSTSLGRDSSAGAVEPVTISDDASGLDRYRKQLSEGTDQATQARIGQILDKTKQLMQQGASEEERAKFKQELMRLLPLPRVRGLETAGLFEPEFPNSQYYREIQSAAAISLLHLAQGKDGQLPVVLAERTVSPSTSDREPSGPSELPRFLQGFSLVSEGGTTDDASNGNKAKGPKTETLTTQQIVDMLKQDLMDPAAERTRAANANILLNIGAINGPQLGAVMQDVLNNPSTSAKDKNVAMGYLGRVATDLAQFEKELLNLASSKSPEDRSTAERARSEYVSKYIGMTSEDFQQGLIRLANNEHADRDLRARALQIVNLIKSARS